jgi:putative pyruvate formate lyase activating enzyme
MREASYLKLHRSGELSRRAALAKEILAACRLCPRNCGVNRLEGGLGVCGGGAEARVSSYNDHHGEEPPISGRNGSGTIFLAHCGLKCVFCQNYPISHLGNGADVGTERLAGMMLELQRRGCHNVNFVTPTHFMPQIIEALDAAAGRGLRIPIVYNCGGYESLDAVRLLDGIVDIYMPDIKYSGETPAVKLSGAPDYFVHVAAAIREMHRQTGVLELDEDGIAVRGLLIRHLVLPNGLAGSRESLEFIAREISPHTFISVMEQYFPAHKALQMPEMSRRITRGEYREVVAIVDELGLTNGWFQGDG